MPIDKSTAERFRSQTQTSWADFKTWRENVNKLVHRELKPILDPRIGAYVTDYQTPDLEDQEQLIASFISRNPTRFRGIVGGPGKHIEDAALDTALWAARTWAEEDRGSWIDRAIGLGQARHGVKLMRMLHHAVEDLPDDEEKKRPHPWYFEESDTLTMSLLPQGNGSSVIVVEYEMPVLEALNSYRKDGGKIGKTAGKQYKPLIDRAGTLQWLGDDQVPDSATTAFESKIKVVCIEYRDKERLCPICADHHPLWSGVEYLSSGEGFANAEEVDSYLLSYKHWPTYRYVSGYRSNDRNPHWRFRPLNYKLQVEATIHNWCRTQLLTLANRDASEDGEYIDTGMLSAEMIAKLPEDFFTGKGWPKPEPGGKEWAMIPGELKKRPTDTAEYYIELLKESAERFEAAKMNPALLGRNFTEVAQGTGTANLQMTDFAIQALDWPRTQLDDFILQAKEDQIHAIKLWEHEDKTPKKFYVTLTGDENLSAGTTEAGKGVYVDATKLNLPHRLYLSTSLETFSVRTQRRQEALLAKRSGIMDSDQVLDEWGFSDTKTQNARLDKEQLREDVREVNRTARVAVYTNLFTTLSEIDPQLIHMGMAGVLPGQPGVTPPVGPATGADANARAPTITLPPLGNPAGGPSPLGAGV